MRIKKAIFSVSEPPMYSSYWNTQSKLCKEGLGIEPICLLFGKKSNTDMHEKYGQIIEMDLIPDVPWAIQLTFSKFYHTITEPETIWMIGDVDLLPLQRHHFVEKIAPYPDDHYLCLNNSGIAMPRCGRPDAFVALGSEVHGRGGKYIGCDLPAHYHVAKGYHFNNLYFQNRPFNDVVMSVFKADKYGMGFGSKWPIEKKTEILPPFQGCGQFWWYWLAEENYTSECLYNAIKSNKVFYDGINYNNLQERIWQWDKDRKDYIYNKSLLVNKKIVDIHCCQVRPYDLQAEALERVIDFSGILK
jgi:hypothetical protein